MSDNIAATTQPPVSSSDVGEQTSTPQDARAALVAPVQPITTSITAQSGVSSPEVASTSMGGSISVPTTSNALPPASSDLAAAMTEPSSADTTSGGVRLSLSLSVATSTPLATSSAPTPLTPTSATLLQLAAATGGSSTTLVASTVPTASTVQCRTALGSLTRPVPRLGAGMLPAPTVAQVPVSIFDIRRGETLVEMPDGLAHSVSVPYFSEGELARLSALGGVDAREMLALVRCYGVEGFASRVMNTTRLLQLAAQLVLTLEAQPTTQADSRALISFLRTECASLVSALTKERDGHAATTQLLADERSRSQPQEPAAMTPAEADALKSEVNTLRSVAGRLSSEKSDLQDQLRTVPTKFAELQRKHNGTLKRVGDLEAQLLSTNIFSPDKLMDFIACGTTLGGHWKQLHQLLRLYRDGSPVPPAFRTSTQVSARDEDTDDVGPYMLQADSRSSSRSAGFQSSASPTPRPAQHATPSSALSTTPSLPSHSEISLFVKRGGSS
ncbi:unnamed protein product [Phytophthora fragariaefolia]|uniref:Unnamed protein product n=1 Tax=Phytophthora fragariaefolia TaxID=1490495 RepID=A0A9W6XZP9_9STRA|nr:unnamed protein product [Phytophthora fragariaefolia]